MNQKTIDFIRKHLYVTIGTADTRSNPHVSPKMLLDINGQFIYLVDHIAGTTYKNLQVNNAAAISSFNIADVNGYFIYGRAEIIESGPAYKKLINRLKKRQVDVAVEKVVRSVRNQKTTRGLKLAFLKPVVLYKITVRKVRKIDSQKLREVL